MSRNFRSEVQTLFGQEKETAKDLNRLQQRNAELEKQLQLEREEAQGIGAAIQRFFANQVSEEGEIEQCVPSYDLRGMVEALIEVSSAEVRPEVLQAQKEMAELRCQLEAARGEAERLHWDLLEARKLKSQEERDLIEFKALREKENELQTSKMEVQQLEAELQEARAAARQLEENLTQQGRSLQEKSDKIISLVQQLDNEVEQVRLLSDENNTLRLELGRDTDTSRWSQQSKSPYRIGQLLVLWTRNSWPKTFASERSCGALRQSFQGLEEIIAAAGVSCRYLVCPICILASCTGCKTSARTFLKT